MVGFDFDVHQVFDFERIQVTPHHQAQVVTEKFDDYVVVDHNRVLGKNRTVLRVVDIGFDRHQAFFTHLGQQLVQQGKQLHVQRLVVARGLERTGDGGKDGLHRRAAVGSDEGTHRCTHDDDEFRWLDKCSHVTAGQKEAADNAGKNDDVADDYKHVPRSLGFCYLSSAPVLA